MTTATSSDKSAKSACWKCGGAGDIPRFRGYADGVCFLCGGSGELPAGHVHNAEARGVHTFTGADGVVWQFQALHHGEDVHCAPRAGESVDSVLLQAVVGNGKRGRTILRARVAPEAGRAAWVMARGGARPEDVTNRDLGLPDRRTAAWDRDQRGIDWM